MYKISLRVALAAIMASIGAAQTPSSKSTAANPAGDVKNGQRIFESYGCYQCHGHDGHGGAGARLAPNPITFAAFVRYVRQPTGEMPPYTSKVVTEQELADIFAYLHSLPAPPAAKSIPLLNH